MKLGSIDIKYAYFGSKELNPSNAFLGLVPVIEREYAGVKVKAVTASSIQLLDYGGNFPNILISSDGGKTWSTWNHAYRALSAGQELYLRGNNPSLFSSSTTRYSMFSMSGTIEVTGNIMSLLDNGTCTATHIPCGYCFYKLFYTCTSLTKAPDLPAVSLTNDCYNNMFRGCTNLIDMPEFGATVVGLRSCLEMFHSCNKLESAKKLPALLVWSLSYAGMFYNCYKLSKVPFDMLPATSLADNCYNSMFANCTSLYLAPELPAQTVLYRSYAGIFYGCPLINRVVCKALYGISTTNLGAWLLNVASKGTLVKDPSASYYPNNTSGIPSGWVTESTNDQYIYELNDYQLTGDNWIDTQIKLFDSGRNFEIELYFIATYDSNNDGYYTRMINCADGGSNDYGCVMLQDNADNGYAGRHSYAMGGGQGDSATQYFMYDNKSHTWKYLYYTNGTNSFSLDNSSRSLQRVITSGETLKIGIGNYILTPSHLTQPGRRWRGTIIHFHVKYL